MDLGHSLDLEHKSPATELGRYTKRYLDLEHLFGANLSNDALNFQEEIEFFGYFLHEITNDVNADYSLIRIWMKKSLLGR